VFRTVLRQCDHGLVIGELSAGDAGWAAGLLELQRRELARYSPVFWGFAEGATSVQERFLRGRIASGSAVALRTDRGFIICECRQREGFVDDFTLAPPRSWDRDGAVLLLAAAERLAARGIGSVRVVAAHGDQAKGGMLRGLSLSLARQWWVRELRPAGGPGAPGRVSGPGFSGVLGPAPPVYNPGGLVFLADGDGEPPDADAVAREATAMGAVLAIVQAAPGSSLASELPRSGWSAASDWYQGWPSPAP
jgi:hypothetical protein